MEQKTSIFIAIMLMTLSVIAQTKDSIDTANMVVTYGYTCHTTDKNGEKVDDHYRLAVLVGNKTTWSDGYLTALKPEKQTRKDILEELDEQKFNIPSVYVGYPSADEVTIRETMLINDYVTTEKKVPINWQMEDDTLAITGYLCQKATAKVRGREWTVWYTEEVPTTAGPWCLYGCPGLIVKAEAEGIHCFELQTLEQKSIPIVYTSSPKDMKIKRSKYINYRNKTLVDPAFVNNPLLFVSDMISSMTQLEDNGVIRTILDDHSFNTSPNTFLPLDLE
ncbi:MAG: GLPGLI family protein [Prevotellaceae bacterium]|nr:GLPGLI family protein [Candidatus Minthosoma caballi]